MSSEFRIEKVPIPAVVSMANGTKFTGHFFVRAGVGPGHVDEDVRDVLNSEERFFPFHVGPAEQTEVHLINRRHVAIVWLRKPDVEAEIAGSVGITPRKFATLLLSNGESVGGSLRVVMPSGRTRVSDYVNAEETFCYVEGPEGLAIVNLEQVVDVLTFTAAMREDD